MMSRLFSLYLPLTSILPFLAALASFLVYLYDLAFFTLSMIVP